MEESKKSSKKDSTESSEFKKSTSPQAEFESATFTSTKFDTTDETDPKIETNLSSDFQSDLMTNTPIINEDYVVRDKENNTIRELGFQEKISLPKDFKPEDVRLHIFTDGFTICCDNQQPESTQVQTSSYHQMKYTRMFDRPIRDVYMEVGLGVVLVIGEFDDFDYIH